MPKVRLADAIELASERVLGRNQSLMTIQARYARPLTASIAALSRRILKIVRKSGVLYEIRTRVAAVKEKRIIVIQGNFATWIALYRT